MQTVGEFLSGPGGEFILFAGLATLTVFSALAVVVARRVTHACLALLPCFVGIAGLYALLSAPVMVAMQILIYAGGITVLLLFAIFLLERRAGPIRASNHYVIPAALTAGLVAVIMLTSIQMADFRYRSFRPPAIEVTSGQGRNAQPSWFAYETPSGETRELPSSNLRRTGFYFLTYYLLPFELSSLVLVVAMVGAIIMARREKAWTAAGVERHRSHPDTIPGSEGGG
jgi:NADH-quinone oxidoreductase subunit J